MRSVAIRRGRGDGFNDLRTVGLADVQLSHQRFGPHSVLPRQRFAADVPEFMRWKSDSDRFQLLQVNRRVYRTRPDGGPNGAE